MDKRIVYQTDDGGVAVITPSDEVLQTHTLEKVAEKDVPSGKPYKIIDVSDLPPDRAFRNAWEVDESILTDGIGSEHNMFITDPLHPEYTPPPEET